MDCYCIKTVVIAAVVASILYAVVSIVKLFTQKSFFTIPSSEKIPFEMDSQKRNAVLKRRFRPNLVPKSLDAIVIGSGMGGLTCASLLAKAGKKVMVLEQHDLIGGCTHAFENKGFEFDIGIHYIGNMEKGSLNRTLSDFITDGQLNWLPLEDNFDSAVFYEGDSEKSKEYEIVKNKKAYMQKLFEQFPDEKEAIKKYFKMLSKAKEAGGLYFVSKILPIFLLKLICKLNLHKILFRGYNEVSTQTLQEVLDKITTNEKLKAVVSYCFGDYGTAPSQTAFLMHAFLVNHFVRTGGFYPEGGASEIAYRMIPTIEAAGGAVFAGVRVKEILTEDGNAWGIRIEKFDSMEIRAPTIISDAGMLNTYKNLLPERLSNAYGLSTVANNWKPGHACFQIMVGLDATPEELNLPAKNFWVFTSYNPEKEMTTYLAKSCEDAAVSDFPLLFVSFPYAKDPISRSRYPGKSTCVVVSFSKYEWFADWENNQCKRRGQEYEEVKEAFADQAWSQVVKLFPQLKDKVVHMEAGSPITHNYYINSTRGEIYGIDHTKDRFEFENAIKLRPETPIKNLYLTGQDVFTCGFIGSAFGGLITASKVLDRYLIVDLVKSIGEIRKNKKVQ